MKMKEINRVDQAIDDIESLRSSGFISIAKQYRDMVSALRIIYIWAVMQRLEPAYVVELTEKTLKRFMEPKNKK